MNNEETTTKDFNKGMWAQVVRIWDWFTSPSRFLTDIGDQRSAKLSSSFLFVILLLDLIGGLARAPRTGWQGAFTGPLGISLIALLITYLLSRTRWYRASIFLFSLSFSSLAYITIAQQGSTSDFGTLILVYVPLSLIVASSFVSAPAVFLLVGLNIGAYLVLSVFGTPLPDNIGPQAGMITVIGLVLMLLSNYRDNTEKIRLEELQTINKELENLSQDLDLRVTERTAELETRSAELENNTKQLEKRATQFEAIAQIARTITSIQGLESLLPRISQLISQRFGFYHVGVFLLDESQKFAVLSAANSEGGQRMLARKHRLGVGQSGIVGYVTATGNPRIALDTGMDAVYFDNPDMPNTRSEMALPLRIGRRIIGALDVQSTEANAFSEDDVEALSILADEVSIAIENARLYEESQRVLSDAQSAFSEFTHGAWQKLVKSRKVVGYELAGTTIHSLDEPVKNNEASMSIPIKLRNQAIGTINISLPNHKELDIDEEDITQAIAERVGAAIENATLLEESQRRATRESVIGEISAKLSATAEIERLMQVAVGELRQALGASEVSLKIESDNQNELGDIK